MTRSTLAVVADTHCDEDHRLEEHDRVMKWIAWDAKGRGAQALLHAGDVYERASSSSRERASVSSWVHTAASVMPVVIVAGNHDDGRDVEALGALRTIYPVHAFSRPGRVHIEGVVDVHCLPWPNKALLLQAFAHEQLSRAAADAKAAAALRAILRGSADHWIGDVPRVLLAHAMVRGSKPGLGQPPLVGQDFELGLEDLALAEADFYALGHIHLGQHWYDPPLPTTLAEELAPRQPRRFFAYPGSPQRRTFGELEEKCYLLVTFEDRMCLGVERIPTPCAPMLHLTGQWDAGEQAIAIEGWPPPDVQGAEVRLRYSCRAEERERARAAANETAEALRQQGAALVKLEDVVLVEQRARAPEVAAAVTLTDQLQAYWRTKGAPPERAPELLAKLAQLEQVL